MSQVETMQVGAFMGPGEIVLAERDVPVPGGGEIVVKVASAGICGSDLGAYRHGSHVPKGVVMGHEFTGWVAAVGGGVDDLVVGERVTVNPIRELLGLHRDGAFAEYVLIPNARLNHTVFRLPDAVDNVQGALVEPLAVALHGIRRCGGLQPSSMVVVQGLGTIGLCALLILKQRGVGNVVAVDAAGPRLELAAKLGAEVHALGSGSLRATAERVFGDAMGSGRLSGVDAVIDATGNAQALGEGLGLVRGGGHMLLLGAYPDEVGVDINQVVFRELNIVGSMAYEEEFPAALRLIASGEIDVQPLVSHHFPLVELPQAFEQSLRADQSIKVMIDIAS